MDINEKSIWSSKQNHPELVVRDCTKEFNLNEEQQEKLRFILMNRGINKWLYARYLFIKLKHGVKESFKTEPDPYRRKFLGYINEKMQNIARMPRWIVWGRHIHKKMINNVRDIIIKGRHC